MHLEVLPRPARQLLKKMSQLARSHKLILAGGTGVALHLGHSISRDIDFFTGRPFASQRLFEELMALNVNPTLQYQGEAGLIVWAHETKWSAFHLPYPWTEPPIFAEGVPVASLLDIAAMKAIAISQRGKKRDFVDLYFILQNIPFFKIAGCVVKRYGRNRINPAHTGKSLVYFNDADGDPEPEYLYKTKPAWPAIKKFFKSQVRQMTLDLENASEELAI